MMSFPIRRASAGLSVVLLLGLLVPMIAAPDDGGKPRGDLPADLALVPHDALWFVTVRVSDVARNKDVKGLLSLLPSRRGRTEIQEFEREFGLKVDAIERFTLVVRRTDDEPIWILRLAKPSDKDAFLANLGDTEEAKVHGKTIRVSKDRSRIGPFALLVPEDRTVAIGSRKSLVNLLAALSRPAKPHPLADELKAASAEHAAVVGLRPALMLRTEDALSHEQRGRREKKSRASPRDGKAIPPPGEGAPPAPKTPARKGGPEFDPDKYKEEPLKLRSPDEILDTSDRDTLYALMPLYRARRASVTIDLGDRIRVNGRADFDSEDEAKDAEVVARMGRYLLREMFPRLAAKQMGLDMSAKGLAALARQFQTDVRAAEIERDGKALRAAFVAKVDPAPLVAYLREVAPIRADENNLKQIAIAFHNYASTYDSIFPPAAICDKAGKPLLSWRVAILPYIEQERLYRQFKLDEAWDSPHNKKLLDKMPKIYAPSAGKVDEPNVTFYQVFTGPNTLYPRPVAQYNIGNIPDGTSNTLLVAEAGKAVPWTKPADIVVPAKGDLPKLGGQFAKFFNAAFCDGSVRRIKRDFDQGVMRNAIDPADGNILDERKLAP